MLGARLTPRQVADHFGLAKVHTVLGWIASHDLPAVNIAATGSKSPRWRIRAEDLVAFERSRMTQPATSEPRYATKKPKPNSSVVEFFRDGARVKK